MDGESEHKEDNGDEFIKLKQTNNGDEMRDHNTCSKSDDGGDDVMKEHKERSGDGDRDGDELKLNQARDNDGDKMSGEQRSMNDDGDFKTLHHARNDDDGEDSDDDSFHTTSGEEQTELIARLAEMEEEEEEMKKKREESPEPKKDSEEEEEEEEKQEETARRKNEEDEEEEEEECYVDVEYLKDLELSMTEEERNTRREESLKHKEAGNTSFREGALHPAVISYTAGLRVCPLSFNKDRAVLYSNRAAARAKMGQKKQAIRDCTQALDLNEYYTKAVLRRATLNQETDQLDEALTDFKRVLELDPSNHQAHDAVRRLPDLITEKNEKLKEEMLGKLKDLGNMFLRPFGLSTSNFELKQDPNSGGYNINFKQNQDNGH